MQTYLNNLRSRSLSPSQVFPDVPTGSLSRSLAPGLGDPLEEPLKASPSMQMQAQQAQQLQHQQQQVGNNSVLTLSMADRSSALSACLHGPRDLSSAMHSDTREQSEQCDLSAQHTYAESAL